jgi:glycosyltransferase involved in cell wall biosynthesis
LKRNDKIAFELIGGAYENRLYKGLGRVTITYPMKWLSYQSFVTTPGRHIGLAPLLNLPFNHARSYTKFFDIYRSGAVGIFSPNSACAEIVNHHVDGLIVELNQEAWADAILTLADDEALRLFLLNNAARKLTDLIQKAHSTYQGLFSE